MSERPPQTPPEYGGTHAGDVVSPSELLADDGGIDRSVIHHLNKGGPTAEACQRWRRAVLETGEIEGLSDMFGYTAIWNHVRGACSHDHDVPPAEYDHSAREWRASDE